MVLAWLVAVGGLVALGFVVYRLFRGDHPRGDHPQGDRPQQTGPGPGSARTILDERFARGAIDEEEYRRRRETLNGGEQPELAHRAHGTGPEFQCV